MTARPKDAASLSWELRDLLRRYQTIAETQWDSDTSEPDPWRALAADSFRFRAELPSDAGGLLRMAKALEETVSLRLELELEPARKRGWLRSRQRRRGTLRAARLMFDRLSALRFEYELGRALIEDKRIEK